jgi:hypothetical protein
MDASASRSKIKATYNYKLKVKPLTETISGVPWQQPEVVRQSQRICHSYHHWLGQLLLPNPATLTPAQLAQALYTAAFVVLSHGTEADPILNYGNQITLDLWQTSWQQLTQMPSRLTAEPMERQERANFLAQVAETGYVSGYRGIRIARNGQRFWIENATVWTVLDEQGQVTGQAATFAQWRALDCP